jgi:hypothetical protein
VFTGLVAATVGLAVVGWRNARRSSGWVGWVGRAGAVVAPALVWWVVVSVHAGYNATLSVGDAWLTTDSPSVPWLLRTGWQVGFHGVGLRWLLLALLVVALLVDARHLYAGDGAVVGRGVGGPMAGTGGVGVLPLPFSPVTRTQAWVARLIGGTGLNAGHGSGGSGWPVRWWRGVTVAGCALAAYAWRDVAVVVAAHSREPGESRLRAVVRGRAAMGMVRAAREESLGRWVGPGSARERARARLGALALLAVLGLAVWWLAPVWASAIGTSPTAHALGGVTGHPGAGAGPQEVWAWLAGLLDGLAGWWAGLSPGSKILVGVGIAALVGLSGGSLGLAFGVSGVATYLAEHGHGAADLVRDPAVATRSYLATATPWWQAAPSGQVRASGPEAAYQVRLYGDTERLVSNRPVTWADGATPDYGAIADAKFRTNASSFYDPASLSHPDLREIAIAKMDNRLLKYNSVLSSPDSPGRVLEIATNDPAVASFIEDRLRALGIPGYVRLEPCLEP